MFLPSTTLIGPSGSLFERLLDDPHALAHLFQAHGVAVEAITDGADGDLEVVVLVVQVRIRFLRTSWSTPDPRRFGPGQAEADGLLAS